MSLENKNNRQAGFTLLELLLVVGVGALLLIGGIATYRLVTEGNKVTDSTRLLLQIKQEAQTLYQNQADYSGLDETVLQGLGVIPDSQRHPFNGDITVASSGGADETFDVTYAGIPDSACVKMGRAITDPDDVAGLDVGGTAVDIEGGNLIADLVAACDGGADITWTFN